MNAIPVLSIRKKDLPVAIGLSKSTIDNLRREGSFPKPRLIANRSVAWPVDELQDWLRSRPQVDTEVESYAESLRECVAECSVSSSEALSEWMSCHNLTQHQAAKTLGVSSRALKSYLAGEIPVPRTVTLACIGWTHQSRD
ncbi:helix-turn-helix transcriptional regulator [Ottowia thiooxydans]|uniref:helix-turn-helix transcriptional regulator n=1 Tax=Ottowia thiooxydans TaxID=219182 RepID=UPI003CCC1B4B